MAYMPGATRIPWPARALPCPKCGNNETMLLGDPNNIEHFQCAKCGWYSIRSGGYTAEVRGWNEDVEEANKKETEQK